MSKTVAVQMRLVRNKMLAFPGSKRNFLAGKVIIAVAVVLFSACCVRAGDEDPPNNNMTLTRATSAFTSGNRKLSWGESFKEFFCSKKNVGLILALILALIALLCDFTGINENLGDNLWKDQGASMWLRLAIVIPGLTLWSVGTFIGVRRMCKRTSCDKTHYDAWKRGDEYWGNDSYAITKFAKKNTSKKLVMAFFLGLVALGLGFTVAGSANYDNAMFWITVSVLCIGGAAGFGYKFYQYHKHTLPKQRQFHKKVGDTPTPLSRPGLVDGPSKHPDQPHPTGESTIRRRLCQAMRF